MRHFNPEHESIQPWPTKRAHIAKDSDGRVIEFTVFPGINVTHPASPEPVIPDDEPVYLLRASDFYAMREIARLRLVWSDEEPEDHEVSGQLLAWAEVMAQYHAEHRDD